MHHFTKSFLLAIILLIAPAVLRADNAVEMITFFPTTYVTYDNLYIAEQLDVFGANYQSYTALAPATRGIDFLNFTLDLGESSDNWALAALTLNMNEESKLVLHNFEKIISKDVIFGKTDVSNKNPTITYNQNLTWMENLGSSGVEIAKLTVTNADVNALKWDNKDFPPCPFGKTCKWTNNSNTADNFLIAQ